MPLLSSVKFTSLLSLILYINLLFITVFIISVALIHSTLEKILNMKCDNNSIQSNSGETYSGYFMPHPGQDNKNRNHVGGTDQTRRFSNTSYSSWSSSSSNLENSNFRSKPKRQYPNTRH